MKMLQALLLLLSALILSGCDGRDVTQVNYKIKVVHSGTESTQVIIVSAYSISLVAPDTFTFPLVQENIYQVLSANSDSRPYFTLGESFIAYSNLSRVSYRGGFVDPQAAASTLLPVDEPIEAYVVLDYTIDGIGGAYRFEGYAQIDVDYQNGKFGNFSIADRNCEARGETADNCDNIYNIKRKIDVILTVDTINAQEVIF